MWFTRIKLYYSVVYCNIKVTPSAQWAGRNGPGKHNHAHTHDRPIPHTPHIEWTLVKDSFMSSITTLAWLQNSIRGYPLLGFLNVQPSLYCSTDCRSMTTAAGFWNWQVCTAWSVHACMHVVWAVTWIRVASSNWIGCFSYDGAQWRCVVVVWCTYIEIELTSYWECTVKGFTYFNFVIQICDRRACGQLHSTECADSNEKVWHYRKRYRLSANSVSAIAIANYSIIVPSQAIDHPE